MTKGIIFDLQKFSVHDGPGIRTIVFFKGCSLRCRWCCNPESRNAKPEDMMKSGVRTVIGYEATVDEVMKEVMKDETYYRRSGGGITLSGGEALLQADFAAALLSAAKDEGISTAVETAANVPRENIEKCIPYIDHFLLDIKHMDPAKHREYTGSGNERIHENARFIASSERVKSGKATLTVRVPTIPGVNDTEREICDIARFAASLGAKELHLLPYHRLGYDKYLGLSLPYSMGDVKPPSKEKMEALKAAAEEYISCVVGG